MKKLLLLFMSLGCITQVLATGDKNDDKDKNTAQSPVFRRTIGGSSFEAASQVVTAPNGGYVMVGRTTSHGEGDTDMHVIHIDEAGEIIWNKRYGEEESEEANDIVALPDGGYLIVGSSDNYDDPRFREIWVVRIDAEGEGLWNKRLGPEDAINYGNAVELTEDGGFIVVGNSIAIEEESSSNMYVVRLSSEGEIVWENTYGGDSNEEAKGVCRTAEGFAVIGNTESFGEGRWDMFLLRIDADGNEIASHPYGGKDNEMGNAVIATQDGGLLLGGYSYSFSAGSLDAWVVKVDANGVQQWHKSFGGLSTDEAFSLLELADGSFVMAGYTDIYEPNEEYVNISEEGSEALIVKLSPDGSVIWEQHFGGIKNQKAFGITQGLDGNFVLVGSTDEGRSTDALVFKLDANGQ